MPNDDATTAIVLVDDVADVPPGCATRVVVADEPGATVHVHGPDDTRATAVADRVDIEHAEQFARALAGVASGRRRAPASPPRVGSPN